MAGKANLMSAAILLFAVAICGGHRISNGAYFSSTFQQKKLIKINSVMIGSQTWMTENLNITTYRNGDTIPQVQDPLEWTNLKTGAWCYFENMEENGVKYGKLYNYYAVNDPRGLAPLGWHIPTDTEWKQLTDYLGGPDFAGEKLKAKTGWENNGNGTNESGFSGVPGGYHLTNGKYDSAGSFDYAGKFGYWWSTREQGSYNCWPRILSYNNKTINRTINDKRGGGMSIRCVKD
jgi:uncharacterized protein (TIGR02145 family)